MCASHFGIVTRYPNPSFPSFPWWRHSEVVIIHLECAWYPHMPMIPPFFLVQSPFSMQFTSRVAPRPPRVFRAPTCEVCAMSLQDLINSQVSTFFAILARLAWIDWEKMQQTEVLLSNLGQACRISTKNPPVLKLLWQSRKRALVLNCHLLEWSSTLEGPNTRPTRVLARHNGTSEDVDSVAESSSHHTGWSQEIFSYTQNTSEPLLSTCQQRQVHQHRS